MPARITTVTDSRPTDNFKVLDFTIDERDALDFARERARALVQAALALNNDKVLDQSESIGIVLDMALEAIGTIDQTFTAAEAREDAAQPSAVHDVVVDDDGGTR
jgi:hypothetical protein